MIPVYIHDVWIDMAFASGGASERIIGHLSPALWCRHDPPVREAARATAGGLAEKT